MSTVSLHLHTVFENFTIVPNAIINSDLPLDTKMVLIWLLSKPPTWQLNTKSIATQHNIGKNKVTRIAKDLQKSGHLIIEKLKTGKAVWHIFDQPGSPVVDPYPQNRDEALENEVDQPVTRVVDPYPQKPDLANGDALVRTDSLVRTEKDKPMCVSFEDFWKIYPKKTNKKAAELKWNRLKVTPELFDKIKTHIQAAYKETELQYVPCPTTYLNGERWNDQIITKSPQAKEKSYNLPFDGNQLDRYARDNNLPLAKGGESSDGYRARLIAVLKQRDSNE